jgi:hypothetical protein
MFKSPFVSKVALVIGILGMTTVASALPVKPGEYFDAKVDNVKTFTSGKFSINFDKNTCNLSKAPDAKVDDDDYAVVSATATGRDQMLSLAVSALLSDKKLRVWLSDPGTEGAECTISAIMLLKN